MDMNLISQVFVKGKLNEFTHVDLFTHYKENEACEDGCMMSSGGAISNQRWFALQNRGVGGV